MNIKKKKDGNGSSQTKEVMNKETDYSRNIRKFYVYSFFITIYTVNGVLIPFFLSWGKLSFIELMLLQSFFTVVVLLFEVPSGAIADYLGRKYAMALGAIITAIAALIYSSYPSIYIFAIGETLWGFGASLFSGAGEAFTYDTLRKLERKEEFSKIWGRAKSCTILGIMVSGPLGSFLAVYVSLPFAMTFSFFPLVIAALIALSFKEPNHDLIKESKRYLTLIREGLKRLQNNKILRILALDMLIIESLGFFIVWTYQIYLQTLGVDMIFFGFVLTLMSLTEMLSMIFVPKIFGKMKNAKFYMVLSTIITGVAFLLMAFTIIVPIAIALILVVMAFSFSRRLIFTNGINRQIESENRATVLSAISMIGCFFQAIIYPFIGFIVEWNVFAVFIVLGSLIIILALLTRVKNEYL